MAGKSDLLDQNFAPVDSSAAPTYRTSDACCFTNKTLLMTSVAVIKWLLHYLSMMHVDHFWQVGTNFHCRLLPILVCPDQFFMTIQVTNPTLLLHASFSFELCAYVQYKLTPSDEAGTKFFPNTKELSFPQYKGKI